METEVKEFHCRRCGGILYNEDRDKQYRRIKAGILELFGEDGDRLEEYTKNYIGYGPNYMYECEKCGTLKKIIPDGRDRE